MNFQTCGHSNYLSEGIAGFLTQLTQTLHLNGSRLSTFNVVIADESNEEDWYEPDITAVEIVICCVLGIEILTINTNENRLIDKACVIRQHKSLRSLTLTSEPGINEFQLLYSAIDMQTILEACQLLEQVAIDVAPPMVGTIGECCLEWSLGIDVQKNHVKTELHTMLVRLTIQL